METKRLNMNDGTARIDADGTSRMEQNAGTARIDSGSTAKMPDDDAGSDSGSTGIIIFATGQPLALNGKNCIIENIISMSSGEGIIYKISIDGKLYVLKHYKFNTPLTDSAKKVLDRIKGNPKERVIHLYDFGRIDGQDFEIMELAEVGSLNQYIKSLGAVKDPLKLRAIVKMIIEGLVQMHSDYKIIYQDLKPDNIYFRDLQKASLLLADFGISNVMDSGDETKVVANKTPLYAAPELTPEGDSIYVNVTPSIDYYALGITMLELWLGEKPFKGLPAAKRDDIILKEQTEFPSDMPEDTKIIIQGLIKPQRKDRWGKIELDKWLAGEKLVPGQKAARFVYDPITIGSEQASNPDELAVLFEKHPDKAVEILYSGEIENWLEKAGDKKLLSEIESIVKKYADSKPTGCFIAVYTLNPGHPFTTKGGRVCRNSEEIASALSAESAYYMEELKKPNAALYLYLAVTEGAQGKKAAYDFCEYFKQYTPKRALNLVYLKLQEEGSITIGEKKYYKSEDMAQEKDASQIALIKKGLNETDSPLMAWLSDKYHDFLEETEEFTELPPWSQFFILNLLPFLSYKDMISDWKGKSIFDLQFLLAEMPGRSDVFESYAKQGLPLSERLPEDGFTPIDFLLFKYYDLSAIHGEGVIFNLIRLLLKLGSDPNAESRDGTCPRKSVFFIQNYLVRDLIKEYIPDLGDGSDVLEEVSSEWNKISILENAGRYKEALQILIPLAEKGDAKYQAKLAFFYVRGLGVPLDYAKAFELYRKAAEQGDALSQNQMGLAYYNGAGVEQNLAKAVEWFRKSAQQNYKDGQNSLGSCYFFGHGVAQNYPKAIEWFLKAAEQNDELSMNMLGHCFLDGLGAPEDQAKALEWFRKSADRGFHKAQTNMGDACFYGIGMPEDYGQAVEWYLKAARQDNTEAQFNLGNCYFEGKGVAQDDAKAVEWFLKAANLGNADAQAMLGDCYTEGIGVKQNKEKAMEWYRKAAEQGHEGALEML